MKPIRESYLLLLIVLGLVSLGVYTTYALFTASTTINDVVGITATLDIGKSLTEYEVITVQPNETKLIELNVVNSYNDNIYYGAWYQLIQGDSNNIQIGTYTEKNPNSSSGVLSSDTSIKLLVGITNDNTTGIVLYLGVKGSLTNDLNLGDNKILLPNNFSEGYSVTLNITNGTTNNNILKVKKGNDAIFTITPNTNYKLEIDSQTCNGTLNNTGTYTITNITEDKTCDITLKISKLDNSGANYPDLVQGLIPVMYDGSKWVKADIKNSNSQYKWYDYDNKLWANAVLVTSTNRSTYQNASAGTTINESDILAYYVWIPRYKYKVWNINKTYKYSGASTNYAYDADIEGINIVFENEKESTGTINCTYNFNVDSSNGGINLNTTTAETCTGTNGDYYTHPAFTFGNDELRGFWIGKFEMSSSNPTTTDGGGNVTNLTVRSLPNVNSWRSITLSNANTVIQNMQISNNIYGLSTSRTNTDSHMLKNMEWGAVAYLTKSNYGRCTNGTCTIVANNDCNTSITGIGGESNNSSTTCRTDVNKYNGAKGILASTTGNITGVYDMSGGSFEFVMGNMSNNARTYTFYSSSSGLANTWYTNNQKYVNTYAYETNSANMTKKVGYNKGRLGDATIEVALGDGGSYIWDSGDGMFPCYLNSWFERGGYSISWSSIFTFSVTAGNNYNYTTSRMALASIT